MSKKSVAGTLSHRPGRKPISEESRRKYGEASRRNWMNPKTRAKRAETDKSPETHRRRSESSRLSNEKPGVRELKSAVQKVAQSRPEVVRKKSDAMKSILKRLWSDPDYIEKQKLAQSKAVRNNVNYGFWNYKYNLDGEVVVLQSSYELRYLQQMISSGVRISRSKMSIPYELDGTLHHYHPDFEYYESEVLHVVEVKPTDRLGEKEVVAKAEAAEKYLFKIGASYEFITELDLTNSIDFSDENILAIKSPKSKSWELPTDHRND
jgi:hypothetical protein